MKDDLLDILRRSGRMPVAELARLTGLSYSTARDRLHRLEQQGVIRGYRVLINPEALDLRVHAWVVLDIPEQRPDLVEDITTSPATERAYRLMSHPSRVLALVHARDAQGLARTIDRWRLQGVSVEDVHLVDDSPPASPDPEIEAALGLLKETELGEGEKDSSAGSTGPRSHSRLS